MIEQGHSYTNTDEKAIGNRMLEGGGNDDFQRNPGK
jgi:hypothetical protein